MKPNIGIYLRQDDKLVGMISVENNVLKFVTYGDKVLENFLKEHKAEWESANLSYAYGGQDEKGNLWDAKKGVKIGDEMYLAGLYQEIDEKYKKDTLGMKYIFHLNGI